MCSLERRRTSSSCTMRLTRHVLIGGRYEVAKDWPAQQISNYLVNRFFEDRWPVLVYRPCARKTLGVLPRPAARVCSDRRLWPSALQCRLTTAHGRTLPDATCETRSETILPAPSERALDALSNKSRSRSTLARHTPFTWSQQSRWLSHRTQAII